VNAGLVVIVPQQPVYEEVAARRSDIRPKERRLGREVEGVVCDVAVDDVATRLQIARRCSPGQVPSIDIQLGDVLTELETAIRLVDLAAARRAARGRTLGSSDSGADRRAGVQSQFAAHATDPDARAFLPRLRICRGGDKCSALGQEGRVCRGYGR